jgi:lipopolysaccharide/colanic/teichoic acid biosynthesis glycosyltransferase
MGPRRLRHLINNLFRKASICNHELARNWEIMSSASQELLPGSLDSGAVARMSDDQTTKGWISLESSLSALLLIVLSPLILLAMVLVRITSRGPVIYTQTRLGKNGRTFTIYKIRTMYDRSEPNGARWSIPGDSRVTPVGRFLRKSHIDELPQLINILTRDMSLVGPRPERPEIVAELERTLRDYRRRLKVRPGLTGLAQVLQPPDTDLGSVRRKLFLDLYYLDHRSLWLDIRIVWATVLHMAGIPAGLIAQFLGLPTDAHRTLREIHPSTCPDAVSANS